MNPAITPGPAPAPSPDEQLKVKLAKSIESFNKQRVDILRRAFDQGGDPEVEQLLEEQDALRDAYFEILQRQLDSNNARYVELVGKADKATQNLQNSIDTFDRVNAIIDKISSVVTAVGKALIVLGI